MKINFSGNKIKILLHLLAWIIFLGIPLYFFKRWDVGKDFIWAFYLGNLINGIIFYSNYLVLVPKFFFGKRKIRYYLSVLVMLALLYFVSDISNELIFRNMPGKDRIENRIQPSDGMKEPGPPKPDSFIGGPPFREMHVFNFAFTSLFLVFFSLGLRVMERNASIEKIREELEKEKLNSELAFLKNQISPHFFFNTLNNIYSLISINADDSRNAVLKLSKMMRYLLYESEKGDTKLSNEIEFMNNYIDLMRLRLSDKVKIDISFPEKYFDCIIPPLLFIPFIENAFKHGISFRESSFIEVSLSSNNDFISFRCCNSSTADSNNDENKTSGIGLGNVKKRLELLFPGRHKLEINKTLSTFEVLLLIELKA